MTFLIQLERASCDAQSVSLSLKMGSVEIEYCSRNELVKYRNLQKSGFKVHLLIDRERKKLTIEGQNGKTEISRLQNYVYEKEGINRANQRLFLAGEELDPERTLYDYNVSGECVLHLKSFVPVLVSSLECPGPMMTEVEVSPLYSETVISVKRGLADKLGIEVNRQRLYLAADEMTSFPRRQEMNDTSLLSRYLSPSSENNFLELRPKSQTEHGHDATVLTFRVPIMIPDARGSDFSALLGKDDVRLGESAKLITLPHTKHEKLTEGWLSLELSTDKIIKRDPLVRDLMMLLMENIKSSGEENRGDIPGVRLKFCKKRLLHGGDYLIENKKCQEDYQIRSREELLEVEVDGNTAPEIDKTPTISVPKPIQPLMSYNERGIRYTTVKSPTVMKWVISSSEELDLGATPSVAMEISGFSHSRLCGSWDVAEHYKTYVEVFIEGTFYVGDTMATKAILESSNNTLSRERSTIYYTQDSMEITIFGPENDRVPNLNMANKNPMRWYRKSAERQKKDKEFWEQTLDRKLGYAPPFRYDIRPINLPKRTDVENNEGVFSHSGRSGLLVNNWYTGKEKVTSIKTKSHKNPYDMFDAICERGTTISGSPYVKVKFKSKNPKMVREESSTAFDFRIQTQFYVCTLEDEFNSGERLSSSKRFTISAKQAITRTKYIPYYSPEEKQFASPTDNQMQTTIAIDLANGAWIKQTDKAEDT